MGEKQNKLSSLLEGEDALKPMSDEDAKHITAGTPPQTSATGNNDPSGVKCPPGKKWDSRLNKCV